MFATYVKNEEESYGVIEKMLAKILKLWNIIIDQSF